MPPMRGQHALRESWIPAFAGMTSERVLAGLVGGWSLLGGRLSAAERRDGRRRLGRLAGRGLAGSGLRSAAERARLLLER